MFDYCIVNDIRNFVFGLAGAAVYGSCKRRKQKFVMSFTINTCKDRTKTANMKRYIKNACAFLIKTAK